MTTEEPNQETHYDPSSPSYVAITPNREESQKEDQNWGDYVTHQNSFSGKQESGRARSRSASPVRKFRKKPFNNYEDRRVKKPRYAGNYRRSDDSNYARDRGYHQGRRHTNSVQQEKNFVNMKRIDHDAQQAILSGIKNNTAVCDVFRFAVPSHINGVRLQSAHEVYSDDVICSNCNELGHRAKNCHNFKTIECKYDTSPRGCRNRSSCPFLHRDERHRVGRKPACQTSYYEKIGSRRFLIVLGCGSDEHGLHECPFTVCGYCAGPHASPDCKQEEDEEVP
jgi:hypothetical protein